MLSWNPGVRAAVSTGGALGFPDRAREGLAFGVVSVAGAQELKSATLVMEKMYCIACVQTVKKALNRVPGVAKVDVDLDKKTAVVRFDESKASIDDLTKATAKAGFPALVGKPVQ